MATRRNSSNHKADERGSRFRRPPRKLAVRRRPVWRRFLHWTGRGFLWILPVALLAGSGWLAYKFFRDGRLFRLETAEAIEIVNADHVSPEAVRERFAEDIGRSLLWIPLSERRNGVEEIPWVRASAVERVLPDRLRVYLVEREPVAYVRQGNYLWLVDGEGVLLPVPEGSAYDFPVVTGIPESFSREQRQVRVELFLDLKRELDAGEAGYSSRLSEVDVADLDDVCAVLGEVNGAVRVHFGRGRYREKFESFLEHRSLWEGKGEVVQSVDLRYRGQIVLNPDRDGVASP